MSDSVTGGGPAGRPAIVSIVIVNYNTKDRLLAALDSLPGVENPFEILVVDNASSDGSAAAAAAHRLKPRVIESPVNGGFSAGVNIGLSHAAGRVVILLNSDAEVDTGAIDSLVGYLDGHPGVGVAGGCVRNPDGSRQATAWSEPGLLATWLEFGFLGTLQLTGMRRADDSTGPVDWVSGAFVALSRRAIVEVGPFDERFFLYAEDIDWCRRARARGLEVHYVVEAGATHAARGSDSSTGNWSPRAIHARFLYHRKHHGPAAAILLRAALSVNWLLMLLPAGIASALPGRVGRRGRRAAGHLTSLLLRLGLPRA